MRFGPCLLLVSSPLSAQTWTAEPSVRAAAHSVYMNSDKPVAEAEAFVPAAGAHLKLEHEQTQLLWSLDLDAEAGKAQDEQSFQTQNIGSRLSLRDKHRTTSFLAQMQILHGYDPLQEKIELALAQNRSDFTSQIFGVYHQEDLSLADSLNIYIGMGSNRENALGIRSQDLQLGWDHRFTELWLQRARVRKSRQDPDNAGSIDQSEASIEQNYFWTKHLSSDVSVGYSQQKSADQSNTGGIWSLALSYRDAAPLFLAGSAYVQSTSVRELAPEDIANLKGNSLYKLGWSRSRESRQQGDAVFYTDQIFATALVNLQAAHRIEIEVSSSDAPGSGNLDRNRGYQSKDLRAAYHWIHRWSYGPAAPEGDLGFAYTSEKLDLRPTEYFREIYSLLYELRW